MSPAVQAFLQMLEDESTRINHAWESLVGDGVTTPPLSSSLSSWDWQMESV